MEPPRLFPPFIDQYKEYIPKMQSFLKDFLPEDTDDMIRKALRDTGHILPENNEIAFFTQNIALFTKFHLDHHKIIIGKFWTEEMETFYTVTAAAIDWAYFPPLNEEEKKDFLELHWKLFCFGFILLVDWIRNTKAKHKLD